MNRSDLIACVAEKSGLTNAEAKRAIHFYHECVTGALKKGNRVSIAGFGGYSVEKRAERLGRNPQTGQEIKIKPKKVIKFKPSHNLSSKVR